MSLEETYSQIHSETFPRKRLSRAVDHVLKFWIPINTEVLYRIKSKLANGKYRDQRDEFLNDLKQDVSLYTWCLRRLCEMADEKTQKNFDPIQYLESIDQAELSRLLNIDPNEISPHSLETSDAEAANVLKEVLLGASCAEILSHKKGIEAGKAYGSSLLRQLGLTMIAWNYPSVFKQAVEHARQGGELDIAISEQLGFSPSLFALHLVQTWGLSEQKCYSFGLMVKPGSDGELQPLGDAAQEEVERIERANMLREVCELGEHLARANNPESYPSMRGKWDKVAEQIKEALGKSGIARIREKFEEYAASYAKVFPLMRNATGPLFDLRRYPPAPETQRALAKNKFLEKCAVDLQVQLKKLYYKMENEQGVERDNLKRLVHQTIPSAGFSAGCVFTMDPMMAKLIPQLKIKEIQGIECKAYDCTVHTTHAEIIASAFQASEPLTEIFEVSENLSVLSLAGVFGKRRRFGVLYLELPLAYAQEASDDEIMNNFQAIARALNDCLLL